MSTTTRPRITAKQQRVLKMLSQGKTPPEIAHAMRISSSGVYGHMRQMRKNGIQLPGENGAAAGHANGSVVKDDPVLAIIEEHIREQHESIVLIDDECQALERKLTELTDQRHHADALIERYTAARELLAK